MSVGALEDVAGRNEDDPAIGVQRRPHALFEELNVRGLHAEPTVLLEAGARVRMVGAADHDVERNAHAVATPERQHLAHMEMKQHGVGDRADRESAFRAFESEARSLAARHQHHAHAPGA